MRDIWHRFEGAVHLLAVVVAQTKCVWHQRRIPTDTNEHQAALEVLNNFVLTGRVITANAMFCHQNVCQTIVDSGAHNVLPVNDDQPTRRNPISLEFTAQDAVLPFNG